jgi:hypothetical protein
MNGYNGTEPEQDDIDYCYDGLPEFLNSVTGKHFIKKKIEEAKDRGLEGKPDLFKFVTVRIRYD